LRLASRMTNPNSYSLRLMPTSKKRVRRTLGTGAQSHLPADLPLQRSALREPGDLTELADSIRDVGLINPITITAENLLIAGERRLLACRDVLGWECVPVHVISTPSLLRCEWAENEIRKAFTVSERVALADAITAEIGSRQGERTDKVTPIGDAPSAQLPADRPEVAPGTETRQHVAEAAGFDSEQQLRRARIVLEHLIYPAERLGTVLALPQQYRGALATLPRDERARLFLAWWP